jgi:hypothetical protein
MSTQSSSSSRPPAPARAVSSSSTFSPTFVRGDSGSFPFPAAPPRLASRGAALHEPTTGYPFPYTPPNFSPRVLIAPRAIRRIPSEVATSLGRPPLTRNHDGFSSVSLRTLSSYSPRTHPLPSIGPTSFESVEPPSTITSPPLLSRFSDWSETTSDSLSPTRSIATDSTVEVYRHECTTIETAQRISINPIARRSAPSLLENLEESRRKSSRSSEHSSMVSIGVQTSLPSSSSIASDYTVDTHGSSSMSSISTMASSTMTVEDKLYEYACRMRLYTREQSSQARVIALGNGSSY